MGRKITFCLLGLLIVLAIGYGGSRFYFHLTDGFSVSNITPQVPLNDWMASPITTEIRQILGQPFYYKAKGCQTYVLVSEDGNYVLKFFKFKHLNKRWIEYLPGLSIFAAKQEAARARREKKTELLFNGYTLAYQRLPQETGILFLHFNTSNELGLITTIYDKLGIAHALDMSQQIFVLQRYAEPLTKKTDPIQLENDIRALITARIAQNIIDHDPALLQNVGYINGKLIYLDVGQFASSIPSTSVDPETEIQVRVSEIPAWFERKK